MLKENSKIKIRSNSMWRFKSDHHNADLDLLNCLDSINMCCIQRNNLFVQYQDLNEKPLIWYWQWLWHKWPLGLHLKWKISNFFTQNILSLSRYVDDVISRIGRMFPDMSIELFRPNGTSAVLLVRCSVLYTSVQICLGWFVSAKWQVLYVKLISLVVLNTFVGAQLEWLLMVSKSE